jgi:MFS family permease
MAVNENHQMTSSRSGDARWLRIIPVAFLMYTIAFMDRINVGVAIPAMAKDLHFSPTLAGAAFGIFFWGYLILQIPGGHLAERWSAKRLVTILLVLWGLAAILTGFVQNTGELLAVRFVLGVFEGGVWPATLVLLAHWFPRDERARANNLWMLCLPVAAIVVSPISGWILSATHDNWRILFWAEGVPPLIWAVIWWFAISDRPAEARWLPETQRRNLEERLEAEAATSDRPHLDTYARAFANPATWLLVVIYFFSTIPGYGISSFFPSLLKKQGLSIGWVGVVTALPFVAAVVGLIVVGFLSDRSLRRRAYVVASMLILGVGLIVGALLTPVSPVLMVIVFILAGLGLYAYLGPFWAIVSQMLPPKTAGGSMGLINALGNLGGFTGPFVVGYLNSRSGNFTAAFIFLGVSAVIVAILTALIDVREGQGAREREVRRRPVLG